MVEHGKIPTLYVEARATLAVEKAMARLFVSLRIAGE